MARTGESGSLCTDRKRDTTASSDGFEATASSCENSGNPSERSMDALAPFLCYGTTEKRSAVRKAVSGQLSALSSQPRTATRWSAVGCWLLAPLDAPAALSIELPAEIRRVIDKQIQLVAVNSKVR